MADNGAESADVVEMTIDELVHRINAVMSVMSVHNPNRILLGNTRNAIVSLTMRLDAVVRILDRIDWAVEEDGRVWCPHCGVVRVRGDEPHEGGCKKADLIAALRGQMAMAAKPEPAAPARLIKLPSDRN